MPDLHLRNVHKTYPGLAAPVLDVPDLSVASGAHVAVTGASGSGKSTLVHLLTGLETATSGRVTWGDTDIGGLGERSRDRWRGATVGLVLQDFHLFPGLCALDNVLLPVRLARAYDRTHRARAIRLIETVGLKRPSQSVETMSRGEMQRVAIARALLRRPGIIIADEPTASLDEASAEAVTDLLIDLSAETASTLIVVSHDRRLTSRLGRCLTLRAGRIVSDDPASEARA